MNIVLKDTEHIMLCTNLGFTNAFSSSGLEFCISDLSFPNLSMEERYEVNLSVKNNKLKKHSFNEKEVEKIFKLFNQYSDNISVSDASTIFLAQKLDNSIIINSNGAFGKVCNELKIKNNEFDWIFREVANKKPD